MRPCAREAAADPAAFCLCVSNKAKDKHGGRWVWNENVSLYQLLASGWLEMTGRNQLEADSSSLHRVSVHDPANSVSKMQSSASVHTISSLPSSAS